jgi:hypothetical protein
MEMTQEVWDRIKGLETKVEELEKKAIAGVDSRSHSFFSGIKAKLATYGIHLDGTESLPPANATAEELAGSGSERWGAGDWTAATGEGKDYPGPAAE